MVGSGPKKWRAKKRECIYTCNRVRPAVLCDNALNTQEDNLVSRSLVDEAFDIRLRQQDILVGVCQGERHLGMRNAETARPQQPIQTPLGLQTYHLQKTIPLMSQPRFKASFDTTSKPQICNSRFFFSLISCICYHCSYNIISESPSLTHSRKLNLLQSIIKIQ